MDHVLTYREVVGILQLVRETASFKCVDAKVGDMKLSIRRQGFVDPTVQAEQEFGVKIDANSAEPRTNEART
jgi:hypothetical protein